MESLLSLTSRRAGEWFKEELRLVGGLDHIADTGKHIYFSIHNIFLPVLVHPLINMYVAMQKSLCNFVLSSFWVFR